MKLTLIPQLAVKNRHPKGMQSFTDSEYAKIATRICSELSKLGIEDIPVSGLKTIALNLALYLEDVIADAGIWRGFTDAIKIKYGRRLPFYDIDETEYYQDEPNMEDVKLLIWYTMLEIHHGKVGNPESPILEKLAKTAYRILDESFETAPINEDLKEYFQNPQRFEDFYVMRDALKWLCFSGYLTYVPNFEDILFGQTQELASKTGLNPNQAYYIQECLFPFHTEIGPLNIKPQKWLAMILRANENDAMAEKVENIESTSFEAFKITNVDKERNVTFKDSTGKSFTLDNQEIRIPDDEEIKCGISCFVKYNEIWRLNGTIFWSGNTELYDQLLSEQKEQDNIRPVYERLIKGNSGSPLYYFEDTNALREYLLQQLPQDTPGRDNLTLPEGHKNILMYIPVDYEDFEIYPDAALSVKDERNPYYNQKAARNLAFNLALSVSNEMRQYLLSHNLLPDATINSVYGLERGNEIVQQNFDFITCAVSSRL